MWFIGAICALHANMPPKSPLEEALRVCESFHKAQSWVAWILVWGDNSSEGWAKCATTWHWLMTVSSTLLTVACTLFPSPWLLPSTCQGKYEFTPEREVLKSWYNSQNTEKKQNMAKSEGHQKKTLSLRHCDSPSVIHCSRLEAIKWIKRTECLLCRIKGLTGDEQGSVQCDNQDGHCTI